MMAANMTSIGVGFGTAALGHHSYDVVTMALQAGFRKFDTAEADWWYDQKAVGRALHDYFLDLVDQEDGDVVTSCEQHGLQISTKIPPWSLTSVEDIRGHASTSRSELVGFCPDLLMDDGSSIPYPLDVYFIHAPRCWPGWHPKCQDAPRTLQLRDAWMAMETVAGIDQSAKRIGLSNIHPNELLDIIQFAEDRKARNQMDPPPRIPDAVQIFADPLSPALEIRKICEEYGIEFVSYSTLGTQHVMQHGGSNPVLTHPTVQQLAKKYSRSVAEVVLSWARHNRMSVIPRSSNPVHIAELARLLHDDKFLTEADVMAIDQLGTDEDEEL